MTGFGAAEGEVGPLRVSVEVRTVNHRFFSPSIKLPSMFSRFEGDIRELMRQRIARGHATLSIRTSRDENGASAVDERKFGAYVDQLRALQSRYGLEGALDIATVLRMPDVMADSSEAAEELESAAPIVAIVSDALDALGTMREAEGRRLAEYLSARLAVVEAAFERIAQRSPQRLIEQRDRLRQNVAELTSGASVPEERIAQEIAILADRLDVSEEISRFGSHVTEFRAALTGGQDPVGKRLGFLLQEMLREVNTTGSKANDAAMLKDVVAVKEELERIREQVENLE